MSTSKNTNQDLGMSNMSRSGKGNINALKGMIKSKQKYSKFYIRQQFGSDLPVNLNVADMIGESGDDHHKIERFLLDDEIKKKRALPSLTDLYDDMLDLIP